MSKTVSFYFPSSMDQRPLFLANPIKRIFTFQQNEVLETLHQIDEWAEKKKYFLAGYISYEAGYSLLGLKCNSTAEIPLIDFYVFENQSQWEDPLLKGGSFFDFQVAETQENYKKNFSMIRHQQTEGNTYQVNYTYQNACFSQGSSQELFYKLYSAQTTKYAALVQLLDFDILSISPELFFSKKGQTIQSKPMKGTLPLGVIDIDKKTYDKLQSENLMIVDLIRNDLSRFAKPETVRVKNLMAREQYPTLQQIVSTVEATLSEDTLFSEIICSLFPCGSITGAPKRRTMEIIQQLEKKPRGVYTGTIGYISPEQDMQFNVAIRTLVGRQHWSYGVGGGLVLDSACDDEWSESQLKKQFIPSTNSDFYLFETLLVKEGHIYDLELHLQRLSESAHFFGFRYDESAIRAQMLAAIPDKMNSHRLRIAIEQDGKIVVTLEPLQSYVSEARVSWSSQATDSRDVFYRHKTSRRSLYECEFKSYREKGYYDVLFLNEKNQLTEASRHNIFISIDGQWYTPPLEVGVLNGVERQKQLKELKAKEKILFQSDVMQAQKVLLTNSVRGCIPVQVES